MGMQRLWLLSGGGYTPGILPGLLRACGEVYGEGIIKKRLSR